jgi:hypothetical protein
LKYYWYDTYKGTKIDLHHDLIKINKTGRLHNIDNIFIFFKTMSIVLLYIYSFLYKDYNRVDWLCVMKTEHNSLVQVEVVEESNDEVIRGEDVFN